MKTQRVLVFAAVYFLAAGMAAGQALTGTLIGWVRDAQGAVLPDASIRLSSPSLLGSPARQKTDEKGQLRFQALAPGLYVLDIEAPGFSPYHEEGIRIGAGATIERTAVLKLAGLAESVVVEGAGSRIEARDPGFGDPLRSRGSQSDPDAALRACSTRSGPRRACRPPRRRAAPPPPISAFGSGTNENQFLIDGTNFTCPATASREPSPASTSFRKCRSSPSARPPSSATCRAP